MRRRILESAILQALWLGPLLGAPMALREVLRWGGPVVPWLLVTLSVLIGARRSLGRNLAPLLTVVGAGLAWAVWVGTAGVAREPVSGGLSTVVLVTLVALIFVPALARSLEARDALEAHFPRTVLADAAAILGSVSFAVLFDLHNGLGFVAALLTAILAARLPTLGLRTALALLAGALLHGWLGLESALDLTTGEAPAALADVGRRGAFTVAILMVVVVLLARSEPRDR